MSESSIQQAKAQMSSIAEMVAAMNCDYERLEELKDELDELVANVKDAYDERQEALHDGNVEKVGEYTKLEIDATTALREWHEENDEEFEALKEVAGGCEGTDEARQRIEEDPLSLQVRSGWTNPGEKMEAENFEILLCTGGPACRIIGELGQFNEPSRAWIEHQDWFELWQEYHGDDVDYDALLDYCRVFYFGE